MKFSSAIFAVIVGRAACAGADETPQEIQSWLEQHPEYAASCFTVARHLSDEFQVQSAAAARDADHIEANARLIAIIRKNDGRLTPGATTFTVMPEMDWTRVGDFWDNQFVSLSGSEHSRSELVNVAEQQDSNAPRWLVGEFAGGCVDTMESLKKGSRDG